MSHKKYQLVKTFTLACAHHIPDAGKCARIHGHNYRVTFCVEGTQLDEMDMLIDFRKVKKCLKERYDHQLLNKFPEFDPERGGVHPTTERVAEVFYQRIASLCQQQSNRPRLRWVEVEETDEAYARFEMGEERSSYESNTI